jgi:hypothetical protein
MRQRQPYRPQLKQARGPGIKDPPCDVDVSDGIAIEENRAAMVVKNESAYGRNETRQDQNDVVA